ncbi:preprotein translocase subunit SecE [Halioxenophilus sp. WMMB6]|uniref:preprotein translocase subunit SecE n=1 Tax=Halioxenophilus sp. WMMB6 TaxID=3073815 RepID=UPI00295EFD5D|nr:preprotein translocase subunit SecE [Halioxenophilus sp. WMMB6]
MSSKAQEPVYRLDTLKWLVVLVIAGGGIFSYQYFAEKVPDLYRWLGLLVGVVVVLAIAAYTQKGAAVWSLLREAQSEVKKVVWPSRQETNQTTLIVVAVVFVMALILWGLDSLLGWIASLILG